EFKGHRYECRPAVMRPASDIQWKSDHVGIVLHEEPAGSAQNPAYQHDCRQEIKMESQLFGQTFNGKWSVCVHASITAISRGSNGRHQIFGTLEFGHHSVNPCANHGAFSGWGEGRICRISEIEITGR